VLIDNALLRAWTVQCLI